MKRDYLKELADHKRHMKNAKRCDLRLTNVRKKQKLRMLNLLKWTE